MKFLTFGEIMLRLKSPHVERLFQTPILEASFGGGEANVAVSLANFGQDVAFCTVLPRNPLADTCIRHLRMHGVDIETVQRGEGRMGIYFLETGANQLPSKVIYDRAYSAMYLAQPGDIDWSKVFEGVGWFHITGITPAISASAAALSLESVRYAYTHGITVSCDLNYRKNLWNYGKLAPEIMCELIKYVHVAIANEEDIQKSLNISVDGMDTLGSKLDKTKYQHLCNKVFDSYPHLHLIAITLRESISADCNGWSACLYDRNAFYTSKHYQISHIVDRVGSGDSFAAGLLYGLNHYVGAPQQALEFAVAASCLKHSISGDLNLVSLEDVEKLMNGDSTGRVRR